MDPTPQNLQVFFTGLHTKYEEGYLGQEIFAPQIAMFVPSDTELETYGWMDRIPQMHEWLGSRTVNNAALRSRSVVNKDWEDTLSIPRNKFMDDKLGLYAPIAQALGEAAKKLDDQQLITMIQSNPIGFDGVAFFATTHLTNIDDAGSTAQSNLLTLALTPQNYGTARAKMRSWKGRDGNPYGSRGTLLLVPPSLEEMGRMICEADYFSPALLGGQTQVGATDNKNLYKGSSKLLVIDELENDPTAWYLIDDRGAIKPFVVQQRQAPNFVALFNENDANVFWNKLFIYGVDSRSAYDVSLWFKALKSKP